MADYKFCLATALRNTKSDAAKHGGTWSVAEWTFGKKAPQKEHRPYDNKKLKSEKWAFLLKTKDGLFDSFRFRSVLSRCLYTDLFPPVLPNCRKQRHNLGVGRIERYLMCASCARCYWKQILKIFFVLKFSAKNGITSPPQPKALLSLLIVTIVIILIAANRESCIYILLRSDETRNGGNINQSSLFIP